MASITNYEHEHGGIPAKAGTPERPAGCRRHFATMLIACVWGLAMPAGAQTAGRPLASAIPGIANGSTYQDLGGSWEFRFDAEGAGVRERWFAPDATGAWGRIPVPGTFNTSVIQDPAAAGFEQIPQGKKTVYPLGRAATSTETVRQIWYQGPGWYRRTFEIRAGRAVGERVILHFLGVMARARVWVNGRAAGVHLFPDTGFELDITGLVHSGKNIVVVEADNRLEARAIPSSTGGCGRYPFGGIYRDVFIEYRPSQAVTRLWMETRLGARTPATNQSAWDVRIVAELANASSQTVSADLEYVLGDEESGAAPLARRIQPVTLQPGRKEVAFSERLSGVTPWTPEQPVRYRLTATLKAAHEYPFAIRTGFRDVRTSGSRLLLNGKPIQLRGVTRHEDYLDDGPAVPRERTRRDLEEIKALGCNFLRTAHYPQTPYVYELCDELGLLAWVEYPAFKTAPEVLRDEAIFKKYALPQLGEMIGQLRQHPAIIIWSVGNEYDSSQARVLNYVERAVAAVHTLDPTRLATFASKKTMTDICFDAVDIIGINEYFGWYKDSVKTVGPELDKLHAKYPGKPVLVTEFGAGGVRGRQATLPFTPRAMEPFPTGRDQSEAFQSWFLKQHLEQIFDPRRRGFVAGGTIWLYNDFRSPSDTEKKKGDPSYKDYPAEWLSYNIKGLVDPERRPKAAYGMVKEFYQRVGRE